MAGKEDVFPQAAQQIELSKLSLQQLSQLKQQLDQVFNYSLCCNLTYSGLCNYSMKHDMTVVRHTNVGLRSYHEL